MYIHEIRAYGTTAGFFTMAPYPHRQYQASYTTYTDNPSCFQFQISGTFKFF